MSTVPLSLQKVRSDELRARERALSLPEKLFILFWLLKPLYLRESGTLQIGDAVFVIGFVVWMWERRGNLTLDKADTYFATFVGMVGLINVIYSLVYGRTDFLMNTSYYVYNLLVVMLFSQFIKNPRFLRHLLWASVANILIQLIVLLLRAGRYYWGIRYMGTFTDPNQFSFFMFASFLLIYGITSYFKSFSGSRTKALAIVTYALAFFFINQGSSTGMLLGIASFAAAMVLAFFYSENTPLLTSARFIAWIVLIAGFLVFLTSGGAIAALSRSTDNFLLVRLFEKIDAIASGGMSSIFRERGIERIFQFPQYLLIGAGEGHFARFRADLVFEIHSTLISLLFCYGLVPFVLLFGWIKKRLGRCNVALWPMYFALFAESFILANQRQPIVYMLILLGSLSYGRFDDKRVYRISRRL